MSEEPSTTLVVAVLAAGTGTRFGARTKQLADVGGVPMVRRVADTALAADVGPVVVVLGHDHDAVAAVLPDAVEVRRNPDHEAGQSTSLRVAVDAAEHHGAGALVVLLGDEPDVTAAAVRSVAGAPHGPDLLRAVYDDGPGHPVRLRASTFGALRDVEGDEGARGLDGVTPAGVRVSGPRPRDVDTPDDLAEVRRR